MIVKVQLPITTTEEVAPMMIYDEHRTFRQVIPVSPEMASELREFPYKGYFEATWKSGEPGTLVIGKRVKDRDW